MGRGPMHVGVAQGMLPDNSKTRINHRYSFDRSKQASYSSCGPRIL